MSLKVAVIAVISIGLLGYGGLLFSIGHFMPKRQVVLPNDRGSHVLFKQGNIRYVRDSDDKTTTVFLHGFNGRLEVWEETIAGLNGCGTTFSLDVPGYAGSMWDSDDFSVQVQSHRIYHFLQDQGLERVTLVGISMGGSIAAQISADYPDFVSSLVLIAPSGYTNSLNFWVPAKYFLEKGLLKNVALSVANTSLFKYLYPKSVAAQAMSVTDSYNDQWINSLKNIEAKAILLWSKGDNTVPFEYAEKISKEIDGSVVHALDEWIGHDVTKNVPHMISEVVCGLHLTNG